MFLPPKPDTSEPAPCDGCLRAPKCGAELLACSAFEKFDAGKPWHLAPRMDASRERYRRLFGE